METTITKLLIKKKKWVGKRGVPSMTISPLDQEGHLKKSH